jgi:NDP-hexose 4-ketoreductase
VGALDDSRGSIRVVVVGSSGFIGRHVTVALRANAPHCSVFGIAPTDRQPLPLDAFLAVQLGSGAPAALREFLDAVKPHAVVNCAGALTGDPEAMWRANYQATVELIDACAAASPSSIFVQIGSSAEYRASKVGEATSERHAVRPSTEYGRSKLRASRVTLRAHIEGRVRATVLRLFNTVGAGMASVTLPGKIAAFLRDGLGDVLTVGSLAGCRDFIDVRDASRAIVCAVLRGERVCGEIINVGSGRARPTREFAHAIVARSPKLVHLVETDPGSPRSAAIPWQQANVDKAKRLLAWSAEVPWTDTVEYVTASPPTGREVVV